MKHKKQTHPTDLELQEIEKENYLDNWDGVICERCGEELSILDARISHSGNREYWVHKDKNKCHE